MTIVADKFRQITFLNPTIDVLYSVPAQANRWNWRASVLQEAKSSRVCLKLSKLLFYCQKYQNIVERVSMDDGCYGQDVDYGRHGAQYGRQEVSRQVSTLLQQVQVYKICIIQYKINKIVLFSLDPEKFLCAPIKGPFNNRRRYIFQIGMEISIKILEMMRVKYLGSSNGWLWRETWNKWMKMVNGNILQWINICYQNIPLGVATETKEMVIEQILHNYKPHLLGLAEPRRSELETMSFPGYSLVTGTANGIENCRLNVLVKDGLQYEVLPLATEIPCLLLKVGEAKVIMLYREWNKDGVAHTNHFKVHQEPRWRMFIDAWARLRGRVTVLGDCNFEFWRQDTSHHHNCSGIKDMVLEDILPKGYVQCILDDTHFQGQSTGCLDHLYTNCGKYLDEIRNRTVTDYDHNMISCKMFLRQPVIQKTSKMVRNLSKLKPEDFEQSFIQLDHSEYCLETNLDRKVQLFTDSVVKVLDELVPLKKVTPKPRQAQYLTDDLKERMKIRNDMRRKARRTGDPEDMVQYKVYRNKLRRDMDKEKKGNISSRLETADPKEAWRIILSNSGLDAKKSSSINLKIDGELVKDPKKVANELSNYYLDKVDKIVREHPPDPGLADYYTRRYIAGKEIQPLEFAQVTLADVVQIISKLKMTGATGHDGISVIVLKKLHKTLSWFIMDIVNTAIFQSKYPTAFKIGVISPVPKPGDPTETKSWRPVTILPAMSKVLEKVLNHQLQQHLKRNDLLSPEQHAYQPKKSTQTAWMEIDSITLAGLEAKKIVGYQLQDMSAAFNLVDWKVLIPKLKMIGCSDSVCDLMKDYLNGRKNSVKVADYVSDPVDVATGVGEGSVLGPLLFLIQILEVSLVMVIVKELLERDHPHLVEHTELRTVQFADDCTNLVITDDEWQMETVMTVCSAEYHKYFSAQGMKLNLSKEEHILHHHSQASRVKPGGVVIGGRPEAQQVKLLGVTVSQNYKFGGHVSRVISNVNYKLSHVAKVRNLLPDKQLKQAMESLVLSCLNWGMELAARNMINVRRLQKTQNSVLRVMTRSSRYMSVRLMLARTKLLSVMNQTKFQQMSLVRRVINADNCPHTLAYLVYPNPRFRSRELQSSFPIATRHGPTSLFHIGIKLLADCHWYRDRGEDGDDAFKEKIKDFILANYDNKNV